MLKEGYMGSEECGGLQVLRIKAGGASLYVGWVAQELMKRA